jgi:hypothetical protein
MNILKTKYDIANKRAHLLTKKIKIPLVHSQFQDPTAINTCKPHLQKKHFKDNYIATPKYHASRHELQQMQSTKQHLQRRINSNRTTIQDQ